MTDDNYFPTTTVRPARTPAERAAVNAASLADNHDERVFTHMVLKRGEIVGSLNVGNVVFWWLDSRKCNRDDTRQVLCALTALLAEFGIEDFSICCEPASPYFQILESKFGCKRRDLVLFERGVPNGM